MAPADGRGSPLGINDIVRVDAFHVQLGAGSEFIVCHATDDPPLLRQLEIIVGVEVVPVSGDDKRADLVARRVELEPVGVYSTKPQRIERGLHLGTRRQLSTKRKAREATIWDSRASAAGEGRDPIYDSIFEKALRAITRVREGKIGRASCRERVCQYV